MSVLAILHKNIKWRFYNAFTIVITILQPVIWLMLYSTVAGQTMRKAGIENYTAFVLPGLIVLVSFSVCSSSGMMNYMMKSDGSFYRILISPVKRSSIVLGQILEAVLCTFLETAIMAAASVLFSVRFAVGASELFLIIVLIFMTSFFMAGLSYGISLILPDEAVYETVMNAIVLPVFFLSTALFPADSITGVLAAAVRLNPLSYVIDAIRSFFIYGNAEPAAFMKALSLLFLLCAVSFWWALRRLRKEMMM